ncbi:hypothetical protein [Clostridium estertheticum]|uniref:hypothetical protein n=1 Tax=Clostridium estertheticum TaxID=238834 RepID=UPI001C0B87D7|nr:hypothetical protein [Clostridium estertheticum]MBU3171319.1 hypothetical protein [Clostridium estertheticum]
MYKGIGSISKNDMKEIILDSLREDDYIMKENNENGYKDQKEDERITELAELVMSKIN